MKEADFEDVIVITNVVPPADGDSSFIWEKRKIYTSPSMIGTFKLNLEKNYEPKEKDKLYFFPGCNAPRFKVRNWAEKHKIAVTIKKENATAMFASEESLRACFDHQYYPKMPRSYCLQWIIENFDMAKGNAQQLYNEIAAGWVQMYFDTKFRSWTNRESLGVKTRTAITGGYKQDIGKYSFEGWCKPDLINEKRYSDVLALFTSDIVYTQEALIGYLTEDSIIIDSGQYERFRLMFKSTNKTDKTLALELIASCNVEPSLHYILLLIQEFGDEMYNLPESKHVNFKSLLDYLDLKNNWANITIDDIIECLMKHEALTMDIMKATGKAVRALWGEQHAISKYFEIKTISATDEIKQYFVKQN